MLINKDHADGVFFWQFYDISKTYIHTYIHDITINRILYLTAFLLLAKFLFRQQQHVAINVSADIRIKMVDNIMQIIIGSTPKNK